MSCQAATRGPCPVYLSWSTLWKCSPRVSAKQWRLPVDLHCRKCRQRKRVTPVRIEERGSLREKEKGRERALCFAVDDPAWDHRRRSARLSINVALPPCPERFHKVTEHCYSSLTGAELTPNVDTMLCCSGKIARAHLRFTIKKSSTLDKPLSPGCVCCL